jgi:hypothetical protein
MTLKEVVDTGKHDYQMTAQEFYIAWHNSSAFGQRILSLSNAVAKKLMAHGAITYDMLYPAMIAEAKILGLILELRQ